MRNILITPQDVPTWTELGFCLILTYYVAGELCMLPLSFFNFFGARVVVKLSVELEAMCHQAERGCASGVQMADPAREEEQVTLLGEEGLRAGGQALKLG